MRIDRRLRSRMAFAATFLLAATPATWAGIAGGGLQQSLGIAGGGIRLPSSKTEGIAGGGLQQVLGIAGGGVRLPSSKTQGIAGGGLQQSLGIAGGGIRGIGSGGIRVGRHR